MSLVHRTIIKTVILPCDGEERTFKNSKQGDMFVRLHKKKCERCRNANFYSATTTHSYNEGVTTPEQVYLNNTSRMDTYNAFSN